LIKHLRNSVWSVAEGIGNPILLLVATPVFFKTLGASDFGLWSLLTTITSAGMVVSVGLSAAIIKLVAEVADSPASAIGPILRGAMAVALIAGGALALITVAAMGLSATTYMSKMGTPHAVVAMGIAAAFLLWLEQLDTVLSSFLKGSEKFGLAARMEISLKSLQMLASILAAVIFERVWALYIAMVLLAAVRLLAKGWVIKARWPDLYLTPSLKHSSKVLALSKWGWLQGSGSLFFTVADRMLIGSMLGSASLGFYAIATQIAAQLHSLSSSAFSVIAPRVSKQVIAVDTTPRFRSGMIKLIGLNVAMAAIGASMLLFFGDWIFSHWVGESVAATVAPFFPTLVFSYFLLTLSIVPFYYLNGVGNMRFTAMVCILGGVLALATALLFIPSDGLLGAAYSRCAYALIALSLFIPLVSKISTKKRLDHAA